MKITKIQKGLILTTIAAGVLAAGCELIVDFDRTRIPVEVAEASVPDANVPDTSTTVDAAADADAEPGDADAGDIGDSSVNDADADQ